MVEEPIYIEVAQMIQNNIPVTQKIRKLTREHHGPLLDDDEPKSNNEDIVSVDSKGHGLEP